MNAETLINELQNNFFEKSIVSNEFIQNHFVNYCSIDYDLEFEIDFHEDDLKKLAIIITEIIESLDADIDNTGLVYYDNKWISPEAVKMIKEKNNLN